ncbi:hypothetical protein HMSSN139_47930 [Paenibacillus sp. HMSSN-139]|nr:hypothetical protein HMSSN139_47930 [Paenibacillus sp. HMSSN-139]
MFGFNQLGNVLAPLVGGFLLDAFGVTQSLLVFAIIALTTAFGVPFLLLAKRHLAAQEAAAGKAEAQAGVPS